MKFLGAALLAVAFSTSALANNEGWEAEVLAEKTSSDPMFIVQQLSSGSSDFVIKWLKGLVLDFHASGETWAKVSEVSLRKILWSYTGETKCPKQDPRLVHIFSLYGGCVTVPEGEFCISVTVGMPSGDPCEWDSDAKPTLTQVKVRR